MELRKRPPMQNFAVEVLVIIYLLCFSLIFSGLMQIHAFDGAFLNQINLD